MKSRLLLWLLLVLGMPLPALAQVPTYFDTAQVKYYAPGATAPLTQSDAFLASAVLCNQAPVANPSTINPGRVTWDDPANVGRICVFVAPPAAALLAFPVGNYEATLSLSNAAGASADSARAPFSRLAVPAAPLNPRFIR